MSWKDDFPRENRYFETKNGMLYCTDCIKIMKNIKTKTIDLILTDPPYGIRTAMTGKVGGDKPFGKTGGKVGGNNLVKAKEYGYQEWDKSTPKKEYFDEMLRISKNQIIFGGNYFVEYLRNSKCWIVWDKLITGNFADCELAWTSFNRGVKKYTVMWNGMLRVEKKEYDRTHPTQKPIRLFARIIDDFSEVNDIILDPFLGSGTTAMACERLNRRWIGIEISKNYCEIAKNRLLKELSQLRFTM